jgi:hypothetical protein
MRDPFRSAKIRLRRANERISHLEKRIKRFLDTVGYASIVEPDADGVTQLHKIRFAKRLPEACELAATEAIQALRDTLDYAGAATVIAEGREPKQAKFPFGDTPADLDGDVKRKCHDLRPEIRTLFRGFNSYRRGNDPLWTLNKLRNPSTHRLLTVMSSTTAQIFFRHAVMSGPVTICSIWDDLKNEIILARVGPGGHFQHDAQVGIYISFDEPEIVRQEPAVHVLKTIAGEVKRVLVATEAEARRIGLVK